MRYLINSDGALQPLAIFLLVLVGVATLCAAWTALDRWHQRHSWREAEREVMQRYGCPRCGRRHPPA